MMIIGCDFHPSRQHVIGKLALGFIPSQLVG
jgi:hypothetical protein